MSTKRIAILGAGISGLTAAYLLAKENFEIILLEKKDEVGGVIETQSEKGFLFDRGPNSGLETTPVIAQLIDELNLKDELIYASKAGNKRYILKNNRLLPLPMNLSAFVKTKLFSAQTKARILTEPFAGRSNDGYYQSVADFTARRLGREFLDYAINPFVAGVYAGNPEELSVKSAFPKLYELEEKYGGLIIGTFKSIKERKRGAENSKQRGQLFSFKNGMQTLPKSIASYLGDQVKLQSDVKKIERNSNGYIIKYSHGNDEHSVTCDAFISTIPAYAASDLFKQLDTKLSKHFDEIYYPPVMVLYLAYNKKDIGRELDGFGFLIPAKDKKSFLGAIWSSVIFENRVEKDKAVFTLFAGGARDPEIGGYDKEILIMRIRSEFEQLMNINSEPLYFSYKFWPKAIPQYNLGYIEHERYFDEFEKNNPGIFLSGNYRGGISVGDCIKNSAKLARHITQFKKDN